MTDSYPPPPFGGDQTPGQPPAAPPTAPPTPGTFGSPPPPGPSTSAPTPGAFGSPPPPGPSTSAPTPGAFGSPPPPGQQQSPGQQPTFGGQQAPGYGYATGAQIPAQPYQYGSGVPGQATLAEPGKRILARLIDWLIMAVILVPMYFLLIGVGASSSGSDAASGLFLGGMFMFLILATVGQVAYEVAFIAIKGQTPGKMAMNVRVVRLADGQIPGWGPATMRWLPNLVSLVPCIGSLLSLGLIIWALANLFNHPMRQTPFDLAAKTIVVTA